LHEGPNHPKVSVHSGSFVVGWVLLAVARPLGFEPTYRHVATGWNSAA
jgi:hypothetical protein